MEVQQATQYRDHRHKEIIVLKTKYVIFQQLVVCLGLIPKIIFVIMSREFKVARWKIVGGKMTAAPMANCRNNGKRPRA